VNYQHFDQYPGTGTGSSLLPAGRKLDKLKTSRRKNNSLAGIFGGRTAGVFRQKRPKTGKKI
jgi:hypothetical protein